MSKYLRREHAAKSVEIHIEQFTIQHYHVLDMQIHYSIDSVLPHGYIVIADAINMDAQDFQDGNKTLTLSITDANDKKWNSTWKIVYGVQIRESGKDAALRLDLMEEQSLQLVNMFWGKGYTQTTVGALLNEYFNEIKGDKGLDITAPTPLQNFAVPVNKPFVQTIEYFREKYKYYIFRTKKKFICKPMEQIIGQGLEQRLELDYGIRTGNYFYYHGIKDLVIEKVNRKKVSDTLPESRTYIYNLKDKKIDWFDYGFNEAYGEIPTPGGGGTKATVPSGLYKKTLMRDEFAEITVKAWHFREIQDLNAVSIVVSSTVDLEPGSVIKMEIDPANGYYNRQVPEQFYKGKWLVHTITEKLIENYPIQKLYLIKPKS